MRYILIVTLVLLIPALTIHERDFIHKKDWQGANDERNTIPSFREGTRETLFLAILAQMQCTSKAQWGSQWELAGGARMDGGSGVSNTARPPHQWGFGVAFLCGDDRDRKGRDAREHAWGPGPRTNSPVSFSLARPSSRGSESDVARQLPLRLAKTFRSDRGRDWSGLVWSGLLLNARRP